MKIYALAPLLFSGLLAAQVGGGGINNPPTAGTGSTVVFNSSPGWMQNLGTAADGPISCSSNLAGVKYATTFTVPFGSTCTVNNIAGLTIHATGACTIYGTITAVGSWISTTGPIGGGAAGGSGGGAAGGTASSNTYFSPAGAGISNSSGGAAGASSGGAGGNAGAISTNNPRILSTSGASTDGQYFAGAKGGAGANSGGASGNGGGGVTLICASISGDDGSGHTGTIDVSGANGTPAAGNSTGSGPGGGGGVVIMSSQAAVATWPTVYAAPGAPAGAGTTTSIVPEALGQGGLCTVEPVMTLGVTAGALSGVCTVITAGTCTATSTNTPAGWTYTVVGGGGTLGTGTVVPVWSSGTIATCTATAGNSSGYTAATFTTSGTAGTATGGWYSEWAAGVQIH